MSDVKKLREETGAGVLDCKKALDEANGDYGTALELIKAKGVAKADKKSDREIGAGHLEAYLHGGRIGVLLELGAETDFVTKSEGFREAAKNIAMQIAAMNPDSIEALLEQEYFIDPSLNIQEYIKSVIAKVGENIKVARFTRYEV